MKIETIRFKNLNSLYGEWSIDLTDREYENNGIFLISGPTGSGKSTILDAICLALYGATPRLKVVSKNQNDIMSRQSGECFAEVTFRIKGELYRVHWSQHRARRNADGKLAESKHEISNALTGDVLESKKRDVAAFINKVTGMDLERFTRSMLLAQGSFAAFLKATADERAPILEQITGTDIYTEISKQVHEMFREETEKLNLLKAECEGIDFLDEEQEQKLEEEVLETKQGSLNIEESINQLNTKILWRKEIYRIKNEINHFNSERKTIDEELKNFRHKRDLLIQAEKAYRLIGDYKQLEELNSSKIKDQKQLEIVRNNLDQLIPEKENHNKRLKELETQNETFQLHYEKQVEVINAVRILDHKIHGLQDTFKLNQEECAKLHAQMLELKSKRTTLATEYKFLEDESKETYKYLNEFSRDESIRSSLSGLIEIDQRVKGLNDELNRLNSDIKSKDIESAPLIKELDNLEKLLSDSDLEFNQLRCDLISDKSVIETLLEGRKLTDYREKLQHKQRERILLIRISSLEEERKHLIDGEPCPLCGSKEHPWSSGVDREESLIDEEINQLEKFISQIESLVEEYGIKERILDSVKSRITKQLAEKDILNNRISSLHNELRNLTELQNSREKESQKLQEKFLEQLKPFNVTRLDELEKRAERWELYSKRQSEYHSQIERLDRELDILKVEIDHIKNQQVGSKERYNTIKDELEKQQKSRKELLGDKDLSIYESELLADKSRQENQLKEYSDRGHKLTELVSVTESRVKDIKKRLEEFSHREFSLTELFNLSLGKYGFKSIEEYKTALLSEQLVDQYKTERDDIDSRDLMNREGFSKSESLYKSELEKKLTEDSMEQLELEDEEKKQKLSEIRKNLGALEERLGRSKTNRIKLKEKSEQIEKQRRELENWQKLHHLIGSADGKKFRNFAQGLTFERVISSANRELVKMTDRYLLVRDQNAPLELNVVDNYQAGEIRSTKNLSGGEGFIISLSLALGLSRISSRRVKVESLFLDEGFGTLDEEALEQALDTLSHLHQEGKLIGVISHIPVLKERIVTQIQVHKSTGGRGTISGPGCFRGE